MVAYIVVVAFSCFAFQFWGCFEFDCGKRGDCGTFVVTKGVGVGWCCALGGGAAANLYVTVPMVLEGATPGGQRQG